MDFALESSLPWCVLCTWLGPGFGHLGLSRSNPLLDQHPFSLRRICVSALSLLIAAVRAALSGLRGVLSALEAAVDEAEAHSANSASGSPRAVSEWDVVSVGLDFGSPPRPSLLGDYDAVASNIPGPSPAALDFVSRISGRLGHQATQLDGRQAQT